jgi:hypothetical protein
MGVTMMKQVRLIFKLSIILLLFAIRAEAGMLMMGMGGETPAAESCTTANDSVIFNDTGISTSTAESLNPTDGLFAGRQFTTTTATTITEYLVNLADVNQTGNIIVSLYTDSSDSFGTVISDTSVTVSNTAISNYPTYGVATLTLATPKLLSATTKYWVRIETDTGSFTLPYGASSGKRSYFNGAGGYINGYTLGTGVMGCVQ